MSITDEIASLADEINYPVRGDDALVAMLIGGGLVFAVVLINIVASFLAIFLIGFLLVPFAFVPQLLTQGYLLRVLDDTLDGGVEPPQWDEWVDLFVDGLKSAAVGIVYAIPLIVVAVAWAVFSFVGTLAGASAGGEAGGAIAGLSVVLTAVLPLVLLALSLGVFYVLPIGLCGMAQDDSLGGAFDLGRIRTVATDRSYAVAWTVAVAISLPVGFVAQLLTFLLVGFPLLFVVQVLAFRLVARGYADALGVDVAPPGAEPSPAGAGAGNVPDPLGGTESSGAVGTGGDTTSAPDPLASGFDEDETDDDRP
jgi:hypothetical protein